MLELHSPLPPAECLTRLKAASDPQWKLFGSRPVLGDVWRGRFFGYKRIVYGNAFHTFVFVRPLPAARGGSWVEVRFGISPFARVFMALWWAGVGLICTLMLLYAIAAYTTGTARWSDLIFLLSPPVFIGGAFGMVRFLRWLGREEPAFLERFVRETLAIGDTEIEED
jgi:hypothetical protein